MTEKNLLKTKKLPDLEKVSNNSNPEPKLPSLKSQATLNKKDSFKNLEKLGPNEEKKVPKKWQFNLPFNILGIGSNPTNKINPTT